MKKSKIVKIVITLLLLVIIASVAVFYIYNPKKAVNLILPDLSRITYINADVKSDSVRTKIDVIIQNKSPYKLSIDSVFFEIKLNDELLLKELVPLKLKQKRYQTDTVELPVDISRKKLKHILDNLKDVDSTNLSAYFYIVYDTFIGKVKLKHDKIIRIPVPIPPQVKVVKVERKKFSLKEKTLYTNILLKVINKGRNINIQLTDIYYKLQVENALESEGTIDKVVTIRPQSTELVEVPVDIRIEHPLNTIMKIITNNDEMNYTLHLKAKMIENMVDNLDKQPIPVEITATGKLELKK